MSLWWCWNMAGLSDINRILDHTIPEPSTQKITLLRTFCASNFPDVLPSNKLYPIDVFARGPWSLYRDLASAMTVGDEIAISRQAMTGFDALYQTAIQR